MPFKPGKSPADVNAKIGKLFNDVLPKRIEGALYRMGNDLGAEADHYVPVEFGTLRNSRFQSVTGAPEVGYTLTIGYYTNYAAALHSPRPGGKMYGWKPKPVGSPGKPRGAYNPDAKQGWFNIAWNENADRLIRDFAQDITR